MAATADIVIENAIVVDGTGAPGVAGGVAVEGDRISAVGDVSGIEADHRIDAGGHVVAPGFIDCHTHDDRVLLDDPSMTCKVTQGVTTVVAGNCGVSLAPFLPSDDWDMPVPMALLGNKQQYRFPTLADYTKAFGQGPAAVNAAMLCGHNTLRAEAMQGDVKRPATDEEIARMRAKVRETMQAGAIGVSSGLMYPAGFDAPTSEVAALAEEAGQFGGLYATHLRDEAEKLVDSIEEAAEIGRAGGVAVVLSHHKVTGRDNWGGTKLSLKRIEQLAEGQTIHFDVYPYVASATALMVDRISVAEKVLIVASDKHPRTAGWYLHDIAEEWGMSEAEAAEELLPAQAIYFAMSEEDVRRVLTHPRAMVGSDGIPGTDAPHPRLWGTFPRVLGYYARQEKLFPLETAVHKMTGHTAGVFGFTDRGVLRKGAFADITVFDPARVLDRATFQQPTTPSDGIEHVIVGGEVVLEGGMQTPARPGRIVSRSAKK
ncbi:MAG: D-aminoacylase [Rhodospirillales bacterium]|nr:D-aminoacylase [Rhodospirillales bacterium]MBO6785438.1 D-aminoacylase [Rhodospirillales bacterium]